MKRRSLCRNNDKTQYNLFFIPLSVEFNSVFKSERQSQAFFVAKLDRLILRSISSSIFSRIEMNAIIRKQSSACWIIVIYVNGNNNNRTMKSKMTENSFLIKRSFNFVVFNRDERRDLNYGWREPEDLFGLFGRRNVATRREGVDSSEEDDDSKDSSESPLGVYRFCISF